jgi:hypothetical protein
LTEQGKIKYLFRTTVIVIYADIKTVANGTRKRKD